jgi:hypothetical protein
MSEKIRTIMGAWSESAAPMRPAGLRLGESRNRHQEQAPISAACEGTKFAFGISLGFKKSAYASSSGPRFRAAV